MRAVLNRLACRLFDGFSWGLGAALALLLIATLFGSTDPN